MMVVIRAWVKKRVVEYFWGQLYKRNTCRMLHSGTSNYNRSYPAVIVRILNEDEEENTDNYTISNVFQSGRRIVNIWCAVGTSCLIPETCIFVIPRDNGRRLHSNWKTGNKLTER